MRVRAKKEFEQVERRYDTLTGKLAKVYVLEPQSNYFCSLLETVACRDFETELDYLIEAEQHKISNSA